MPTNEPPKSSLEVIIKSTINLNIYGLFGECLVLMGFLSLLFIPITFSNWITIIVGAGVSALIDTPIKSFWVPSYPQEQKIRNYKIGYVVLAVVGLIPRVAVLYCGGVCPQILWYTLILSSFIIKQVFAYLIFPASLFYKPDLKESHILISISTIAHYILLILSIQYGMVNWSLYDMISNIIIQLFLAPVCWEAMTACILLMSGKIRTRTQTQKKATVPQAPPAPPIIPPTPRRSQRILSRQQVGTPAPPPPPPPPPTIPTFDCQICGFEYSNTLFPRMIKECGHTICEKCANHFLRATRFTHLFCPFCKKATVVNGRASWLPKNLTIVKLMNN